VATVATVAKSSGRGSKPGERRGGRVKGVPNKATAEIRAIAQPYSEQAVKTLAQIMQSGQSEAARVSAASAILDRAWGRPSQSVHHSDPEGGPVKHVHEIGDDLLAKIALGR
jgi:hypothetical protein